MAPPVVPADRHKAAELLLAGYSIPEAAAQLGRRRETVWRWAQDPVFAGWLSEQRQARRLAVATALDDAALEAVRLLRSVLNDPGQPGSVRVRAAAELLDRAGVTSPVAVEVRSSPAPVRVDLSGLTREQVDALAEGGLG